MRHRHIGAWGCPMHQFRALGLCLLCCWIWESSNDSNSLVLVQKQRGDEYQMHTPVEKPQALIFDLDGTLFRTESLSLDAYHATFEQLREEGLFEGPTPPEERFLSSLGLLLEEIWKRVIPDSSPEVRRRADELLLVHQMRLLEAGLGELYEGVADTLRVLHTRGYQLFVASNGLEGYVKGVVTHMGLADLFTDVYSAGEYETNTKVDLVRLLMTKHNLKSAWMCGDRSSDVEAGRENGLFVVGCNYAGFNQEKELQGANLVLFSFAEIQEYLVK